VGWRLDPEVDAAAAAKTIVPIVGSALGNAPRDARLLVQGNAVVIAPSSDGSGPDIARFVSDAAPILKNAAGTHTVVLHAKTRPAQLTTAEARAMGVHDKISTFTTTFSGGAVGRANNIRVLAAALDGKLVAPGATFSVNGAVGERTAAKGYQAANAIVQGKLVPQVGGGICQVCTTLFNAVFMSGLPILERQPHSFYISHYPTGRDATVSWGGPDLRWKNTTSHWVLVSVSTTDASSTAGAVTISLWGTNPGYNVAFTTGPFTNIKPFPTVNVPDPTIPAGSKAVLDPGAPGGRVVVVRTVKKQGTLVRQDTFVSDYTPKEATVRVGTKTPVVAVTKKP
ncbi:MAG: VanW family protein, partial [Coriobacteriia bacterium]|nr:VanW family protein [Coriobacteriia bacterium]